MCEKGQVEDIRLKKVPQDLGVNAMELFVSWRSEFMWLEEFNVYLTFV